MWCLPVSEVRPQQGSGEKMHGVLALPDTIYFPTSAGIEMCINEYMKQVLIECAPSCTDFFNFLSDFSQII
jgi:hypothetical protein